MKLFEEDSRRIEALGRPAASALRVHQYLQRKPLTTIPLAAQTLGLSVPTVTAALVNLEKCGLVRELTGQQRNRMFVYDNYLRILNRGTEPL